MGPALVRLRRRRSPPSISASPAEHLPSLSQSSNSGRPENFRVTQKLWFACFPEVLLLIFFPPPNHPQPQQASTFFIAMHVSHAFFFFFENWDHFLTSLPSIAPSSYSSKICMWISTRRKFLAFKKLTSDCTLHVAVFPHYDLYL